MRSSWMATTRTLRACRPASTTSTSTASCRSSAPKRSRCGVIEQLGLEDAKEFTRPQNVIVELASRGLGVLRSMIRLGPPPPVVQEQGIPRGIVEEFGRRLFVDRVDDTFVTGHRLRVGRSATRGRRRQCRGQRLSRGEARRALRIRCVALRPGSRAASSELREKAVASDQLVQQYKREQRHHRHQYRQRPAAVRHPADGSFHEAGGGAEGNGRRGARATIRSRR